MKEPFKCGRCGRETSKSTLCFLCAIRGRKLNEQIN